MLQSYISRSSEKISENEKRVTELLRPITRLKNQARRTVKLSSLAAANQVSQSAQPTTDQYEGSRLRRTARISLDEIDLGVEAGGQAAIDCNLHRDNVVKVC